MPLCHRRRQLRLESERHGVLVAVEVPISPLQLFVFHL